MAASVAVTELVIDARGSETGSARYVAAMAAAQRAADRALDRQDAVNVAQEKQVSIQVGVGQSIGRTAAAWDRLRSSIDPTFQSAKALERALVTVDNAATKLGVGASEVARVQDLLRLKHDAAALAAKNQADEYLRLAAAGRAAQAVDAAQGQFNAVLGVRDSASFSGSASASAAAFSAELDRMDEIARQKAQQIGSTFAAELDQRLIAGTGKSARDAAAVFEAEFGRIDEIARQKAQQAGANFNQALNASFGIGSSGKSAQASAGVFEEAAREAEQFERRIDALRASINPLGAAQDRLNAELAEYAGFAERAQISTAELAAAQAMARARFEETSQAITKQNGVANGDVRAHSTSNIAAQFQDILVTGAMPGANALTIALQQGTQLSAVLGPMGATGAVKGLIAGFTSLLSVTSLLTIGLIAVGVVAVQWIASMLPKTETATQALKRHRDELSEIVTGYDEASKAADDYFKSAGRLPQGAVQSELAAQAKQMNKEAEDFLKKARDIGPVLSGSLNATDRQMGKFLVDFAEGRDTAAQLATNMTQLANSDLGLLGFSVKGFINDLRDGALKAAQLHDSLIGLSFIAAGAATDDQTKFFLDQKVEGTQSKATFDVQLAAINARSPAQQAELARKQKSLDLDGQAMTAARKQQEIDQAGALAYAQASQGIVDSDQNRLRAANDNIATTRLELSLIGAGITETERLTFVRQNLASAEAEAAQNGTTVSAAYRAEIEKLGAAYGDLKQQIAETKLGADIQFARDQLGRSSADQNIASQLRPVFGDDLNSAQAQFYAGQLRINQALTDFRDVGLDLTGGFFADLKSDLMNGISLWDGFANAGANALNKIADKALSMAADGIFDMIFKSVAGAFTGGGGFDPIGSGAGSFSNIGKFLASAKGNVFHGAPGLSTYSNQIVTSPTIFPFAKGASFGVMAEEKPEAVMPLGRDSSGRLGVHVAANQNAANMNLDVKIYNQTGAQVKTQVKEGPSGKRELEVFVLETVRDATRRGVKGF